MQCSMTLCVCVSLSSSSYFHLSIYEYLDFLKWVISVIFESTFSYNDGATSHTFHYYVWYHPLIVIASLQAPSLTLCSPGSHMLIF